MPVSDEAAPFPYRFRLPQGFHELDLAERPEPRAERLLDSLRQNLPGITDEQLIHAIIGNQYAVERLVDEGTIYAANFIGRSDHDPTAASTAQFTLMVRPTGSTAREPLEVIAEGLRKEPGKSRAIDFVDLPIRRCLVVTEEDSVSSPVNIAGAPTERPAVVRQIQVSFPLPEPSNLAVFTLSTQYLRDWDEYVKMMAEICKTISWRDATHGRIGSVLNGGA
ncbi:MAG: hypothetical protein ACRDQ5_11965 [Sciscionella sp.]